MELGAVGRAYTTHPVEGGSYLAALAPKFLGGGFLSVYQHPPSSGESDLPPFFTEALMLRVAINIS